MRAAPHNKKKKMEQTTPHTSLDLVASSTGSRSEGAAHLSGDILYGAEAIALFIYGKAGFRRTVYNLIQQKALPHFKLGAILCARKSILLKWIEEQENGGPCPPLSR
jgi:hypothetical protein